MIENAECGAAPPPSSSSRIPPPRMPSLLLWAVVVRLRLMLGAMLGPGVSSAGPNAGLSETRTVVLTSEAMSFQYMIYLGSRIKLVSLFSFRFPLCVCVRCELLQIVRSREIELKF